MTEPLANLVDSGPRSLGSLGEVGPLAFGCWRFAESSAPAARARIEAALAAGMNLIDTADVYGFQADGSGFGRAEEILGDVLREDPHLRAQMVLATKGGILPPLPYDQSPAHLRRACDESLRRLGVETIDLYQVHRPDLFTHPSSLAETLAALRQEGKIREVGVSNFTVAQHDALAHHLPFPIVATQPQFSATHLDPMLDGTFDRAMRDGVSPLAWSPLAGGRLATGDTGEDGLPRSELIGVLDRLAEREGVTRADAATAFVLAHPSRPVAIIGTQNVHRITAAPAALGVHLDRNDAYDIIEASTGERMP